MSQTTRDRVVKVNKTVTVELDPWEYVHASNVGIARYAANWDRADAAHYDKSRMEDDRTAQVAAAICELAVAKHTNQYWSGSVWHISEHSRYKHYADVGHNIEVRRIRTSDPAVRRYQLGKDLVLYVARVIGLEFRQVELLGWLPYDDAWNVGYTSHYDANTKLVPLSLLRSPR